MPAVLRQGISVKTDRKIDYEKMGAFTTNTLLNTILQ